MAFDIVGGSTENWNGRQMSRMHIATLVALRDMYRIFYIAPTPSACWDAVKIVHNRIRIDELPVTNSLSAYLDYHQVFLVVAVD